MERACELLRNRLDDLQEVQTAKESFSGSALNSLILRLKRQERLRVLRENEIMDALFSFKTAGRAERIAFESSSCELMKRLAPHFEFESKSSGLYKDIASLYSSFYKHINNPLKVEEIRVINQNTTYHNFPFLCMLLKGIVQYAKGLFLQALAINSQITQLPQPSTTTSAGTSTSNNNHHPKYYRSLTPPLSSSTKQTLPPQQHHLPASPESKQCQPPPSSSKFKSISQGATSTTPSQSPINTQPSQVRDTSQQFPPQFPSTRQQQHYDDRAALSTTSNPIKRNQSTLRFNGQEPSSITPSHTFLGFARSYPITSKQKFLAYQQNVLALQPSQSFNAYNFTQTNSAKNKSVDIQITQGHLSVLGSVQFSKRGYYRPIREAMDDIDCLTFKRNELLANFYYKTMLNRNQCIARTIDFHRNCNGKNVPKYSENQQQGQPQIDENTQAAISADQPAIQNIRTHNGSPTKPLLIKSNSQSQLGQTKNHTARSNNKNNELSILIQRESGEQELNPCRQSRTDVIPQTREIEDRGGRFSCSNSERIIQNQRTFQQEQRTIQIQQEGTVIESFNTERLICIKGLQNVTSNSGMNAEENTTFMNSNQIENENCARVTVQNSLLSIIQLNSSKGMNNSYKQKSINKLSDTSCSSNNNDKGKTLQQQYQQNKSKRALSLSCPEKDQAETKTQQPLTAKPKQKPTLLANIVDECQTKEQFTQSKTNQSGQALWRRSILTRNKPQQPTAALNVFAGAQDISHLRCGSQNPMETVKPRSRAISNGNVVVTQSKKQQSGYYFRGNFSNRNNNQYYLHKQQSQHQQYPISFDMLREFEEEEEAQRLNQLSTQEPEQEDNKLVCPLDYEINNNHKTLPLYNIADITIKGDVEGVLGQQSLLPVIPQPNIASKKEQKQQSVYQQQSTSLSAQQQQFLQSYRPSHSLENQSESAAGTGVNGNQHKNKRAISYSSQLEAFNNQLIQRKDRLNGIILQQNVVNDMNNRTGSSMRIESSLESYQSSKATTPIPGSARKRQLVEDVILPSIA